MKKKLFLIGGAVIVIAAVIIAAIFLQPPKPEAPRYANNNYIFTASFFEDLGCVTYSHENPPSRKIEGDALVSLCQKLSSCTLEPTLEYSNIDPETGEELVGFLPPYRFYFNTWEYVDISIGRNIVTFHNVRAGFESHMNTRYKVTSGESLMEIFAEACNAATSTN